MYLCLSLSLFIYVYIHIYISIHLYISLSMYIDIYSREVLKEPLVMVVRRVALPVCRPDVADEERGRAYIIL